MSLNSVMLSGNLTRDPELRQSQSGNSVLKFCLAVNDHRKDAKTGEWKSYPNYVDCTMFGKRGEAIFEMLHKGQKVALTGSLRWSQWESNGEKRSKLEVVVNNIDFMGPVPAPAGSPIDQADSNQNPEAPASPQGKVAIEDAVFEEVNY